MASTLKIDTITTPDGTGNITVSRPLSGSGASLTSLPAANLTGTLPAIDGSNLTGILPAVGSSGNVLTSDGSNWASTAPAGGGAWTLISTGTASNSATLDFTGLSTSYDVHVLVFSDCRPSSNSQFFRIRLGTGSTTWETNGYKYLGNKRISLDGNDDHVYSDNDSNGQASFPLTGSCSNATGANVSGYWYSFNTASTGHKHFSGQFPSSQTGTYLQGGEFFGQFTKTNPVTGFRVFFNSGNIASGKVRLYGINNS